MSNKYGLRPLGEEGTGEMWGFPDGEFSREYVLSAESGYACNIEKNGYWCAALIFHDGWEIKDDYPW